MPSFWCRKYRLLQHTSYKIAIALISNGRGPFEYRMGCLITTSCKALMGWDRCLGYFNRWVAQSPANFNAMRTFNTRFRNFEFCEMQDCAIRHHMLKNPSAVVGSVICNLNRLSTKPQYVSYMWIFKIILNLRCVFWIYYKDWCQNRTNGYDRLDKICIILLWERPNAVRSNDMMIDRRRAMDM